MLTAPNVLIGLLGLVTGSFLNVVIHRLPRGESVVTPGSHCPHCRTPIRPWHNIPILSWAVLRGRSACCQRRISPRYPLVEAATAALFVAMAVRFGTGPALPAYLYLAAVAVALAVIDLAVLRLPDPIVLPSYLVAAVLLGGASAAGAAGWGGAESPAGWWPAARALLAMVALFGFYFALAFAYPAGMGFGDVKLAGLLGLYLGWLGWGHVLVGTFAAVALGGLVGAVLLVLGRATRKTAIPFGPYLLAGAVLALFVGEPITTWYLAVLRT